MGLLASVRRGGSRLMRQPVPFGKYVLLERISVGGMAEVFKAKSFGVEGFEKILAIKRILPSLAEDSDFIEMFIDEAKICGQLNHANICQIFELGRVQDSHFIAMEFVWGKDLLQIQNRLRKHRQTMSPQMAAFVAAKLCEGLDYAHKKKDPTGKALHIIHRDISPQNILVSYEGELKIIDFGIAKAASRSSKTQAGVLKGKFGYMSPEQVRGLPLDRRSDVFAIGTILYELLTSDRLFFGDSDFETLEKVRNVDCVPPSKANPACPPRLEKIILKALTKEVEDRYQWASEMMEDLQAFLMGFDPVFTAKQLSTWMREGFASEMKREQEILDEQRRIGREVLTKPLAAGFGNGVENGHGGQSISLLDLEPPPPLEDIHFGSTRVLPDADVDNAESTDDDEDTGDGEEATIVAGPSFPGSLSIDTDPEPLGALPAPPLQEQKTQILLDQAPIPSKTAPAGGTSDLPAQPTVILMDGSPAPVPQRPSYAPTLLDAPPPVVPVSSQLGARPPTGQVGVPVRRGETSHVATPLPYAPRSTLWKDIFIGIGVAAAVVAGVLGVRAVLQQKTARGTLVVMANPARAANVLVDGQLKGHLDEGKPLTLKDLPVGQHAVVVTANDGARFQQTVQLQAGDVSVLSAALTAEPVAQVGSGTLKLKLLTDGAQVEVDGAQLADGAWKQPIPLRADVPHEIRVTKPQREEVKLTVVVKPGEELAREVELLPGYGKIKVTSDPPGAEVTVNGKRAGVTPTTVGDLDPGKQARVSLKLKGFAAVTKAVAFDKSLEQTVDIKMMAADDVVATDDEGAAKDAAKDKDKPKAILADVTVPEPGDKKPHAHDKEKVKEKEKEKDEPKDELASVKPVAIAPKGEVKPATNEPGFLVANTQPWAKVIIDGKDTGKTTPIAPRSKIPLKPGKHVVTFLANGKKFNFDIVVKSAEDTRLIKQLTDAP